MPNHGGDRPGSGRPKLTTPGEQRNITMTTRGWQLLREITFSHGLTQGEAVEALVALATSPEHGGLPGMVRLALDRAKADRDINYAILRSEAAMARAKARLQG